MPMTTLPHWFRPSLQLAETLLPLLVEALRSLLLCLRPATALAAENLFLRKQLALYQERHIKPRRATKPPASAWYGSGAGSTGVRR